MDKLELLAEQYKNCCAENEALKAENARYRAALEFYADLGEPSIYVPFLIERPDVYHASIIEKDMGEIAREALKGSYESDS